MPNELSVLMITAASIGLFHTLFGPDHYIPFIVMAKARKWSYVRTSIITLLCGIGHVGSSIVLGLLGISLGIAVEKLELFESTRGSWAAWALIAFGLMYFLYGVRSAIRNKPHSHIHIHGDGDNHAHEHTHHGSHVHVHDALSLTKPVPWSLFVIFVFGPCEPLIPLLMYPAAQRSMPGMVMVATIFSITTICTMMAVVLAGTFGISLIPFKHVERYAHALSGLAILLCGCAIQFLGL